MPDLHVLEPEPIGKKLIEILETRLEQARNGELSSLALATVKRDGSPDWDWSDAPNNSTLLGAIERMKADLIREADVQD